SAQAHQAHSGNFAGGAQYLIAAGYLALNAVTAGPHEADDMQQLAATIEPGLHPGQSSGWCTVAQPGQQPVNDPHQGEGDAHDAAVIMRGNANVTAFNGEADEPPGGKQQ